MFTKFVYSTKEVIKDHIFNDEKTFEFIFISDDYILETLNFYYKKLTKPYGISCGVKPLVLINHEKKESSLFVKKNKEKPLMVIVNADLETLDALSPENKSYIEENHREIVKNFLESCMKEKGKVLDTNHEIRYYENDEFLETISIYPKDIINRLKDEIEINTNDCAELIKTLWDENAVSEDMEFIFNDFAEVMQEIRDNTAQTDDAICLFSGILAVFSNLNEEEKEFLKNRSTSLKTFN